MRGGNYVALGVCLAIVVVMASYSYMAQLSFNPYPHTTSITAEATCSAQKGPCPGFKITSANLTVMTLEDLTSQELTLDITATGSAPMDRVQVFFDNVSLGFDEGPFAPGVGKTVGVGVPTTITVNVGQSYPVLVEGIYVNTATGQTTADYWQSLEVVAS